MTFPDFFLVSLVTADGKIGRVQVAGCVNATQAGEEAEIQRKARWYMSRGIGPGQVDPELDTIHNYQT